jgi:alpha-beta hydrolase superfamily lysophospholipase
MEQADFSWLSVDQTKLFGRVWHADGEPKAVLALVHGMGEHCGRYRHVAEFFTRNGISVISFDQRGHGRSEGQRGHAHSYRILLESIDELVDRAKTQFKNKPVFLYGHSMGGNLVLNYMLRKPFSVKGVVVTSPWLRLAFEPPKFKVKLGRWMRNIYPSFSQATGLVADHISRDPEVVKAYKRDKYVHDRISASFFMNIYEYGYYALKHASEFKSPLLLMHAAEDKLTSAEASADFAKAASNVTTFRSWEGLYHEIHNEPEKLEVFQYTLKWINEQLHA